ncbi:WXG100 family type VII secretion target [Lipingzhangella sp. LS1_29]|uniref:WXG100 family type VII secretion target n=1 Tax=Lipingzhangella rawalii TaxID=2055835 RepID=A0ABU2H6A0_9ACTN|nr:WXG100 family type VII secretion target [Lipingzhangella rawalii]MDS1270154.1 WXG100 family type VII secretion target [Lipingzhangella rawalii]
MSYEVYGNVGMLEELSADQQGYMSRFHGIMDEIRTQSEDTVNRWEGAGSQEFQAKAEEFDSHFNGVLSAFAKMIDATDESANNYSQLVRTFNNMF